MSEEEAPREEKRERTSGTQTEMLVVASLSKENVRGPGATLTSAR